MTETEVSDTTYKLEDSASYDNVTVAFDDLANRYSLPVAEALARAIEPASRNRVLDIGCGTGIVSRTVAGLCRPEATVLGIDLSNGMLATAEERAKRANLHHRLQFRTADAEAVDMEDGCFDGYVSLYAYSHFPNPDHAAREAYRLLSPGGRLAVAIGSGPAPFSSQGVSRAFSRLRSVIAERRGHELNAVSHLVRRVREHLPTTDETMIAAWSANQRYPTPRLAALIRDAGFVGVRIGWVGADFVIPTIEAFWVLQTTLSTWSRKFMQRAENEEIDRLKRAFWDDCRAVQDRGGRLMYRVGAGIVSARRP